MASRRHLSVASKRWHLPDGQSKRQDRVWREARAAKSDLEPSLALGMHGIRLSDVVSI